MISLVAALGKNREIGFQGKLPWHLPDDFKRFKELTTGHTVIMGRKTFESIGKPLPNRKNIIVTRSSDYQANDCYVVNSFGEALGMTRDNEEVFVIGGGELYALALSAARRMYLTTVDTNVTADSFFPSFNENEWREVSSEFHPADERNAHSFTFRVLERI